MRVGLVVLPFLTTASAAVPPVVPGFPNVPRQAGELISGLHAPEQGRTAIIAYHNGVLFTIPEVPSSQPGADFQVRTWDLSDPAHPIELGQHGVTAMPVNAHGYLKSGPYLSIGENWPPEAPWSFRADEPGTVVREASPDLLCAYTRGCLFQPWFVGQTWSSYLEVGGDAYLELDGERLSTWDHLGSTGVIGHPFLLGDRLIFASEQSRTGVATYDVGDPTNPTLLDVLTDGGPGGYWTALWGGDGRLYSVFPYRTGGNGFRVVDLTDPTDLRLIADRALPGAEAMYVQFQDHYAFIGDHKVDMRTFESVLDLDGASAVRTSDGGIGIDTSQFALPLGNLLVTGGVGVHEGMAIWAHSSEADTRGPEIGFHVPESGRTNYPVTAPISLLIHETLETPTIVNGETFLVRPLGGEAIDGRLTFSFDDILTFTPSEPLAADTTYEVVVPADGIRDAAGNGIVAHAFTFSTGSVLAGNRPPEIESLSASAYPVAPGEPVSLNAVAHDPDGDDLELRFDLGDGSPKTAWATSATVEAFYPNPGHYRASVQARDTSGTLVTVSTTVTVVEAPAGPRATHGAPVVCGSVGRRVWTVNPDNGTLSAVDPDGLRLEAEIELCAGPSQVARTASGELWVSCRDDDRLHVVDAVTGARLADLPTGYGSAPYGVAASPDGRSVYVTLEGDGRLLRYDAGSRVRTGEIELGPSPRALAVSADGTRILVTRFLSPKDHAEIWDVDASTFTRTRTLVVPKFGGDDHRDTTASGRGTANYLAGVVISQDGRRAWVSANKPNAERGPLFGPDLDPDNTVRNVLIELDLVEHRWLRAIDVDNSDSASGMALSPLGDYLFVALQGNDALLVLDALELESENGLGSTVTRLAVGSAPQGVCVDAVTGRTFVKNFLGRDLTAIDTATLFVHGDISPSATSIPTVEHERLPEDVLLGKRVFYFAGDPRMSSEGYLSCASCHVDGGHDGRVWDFTGRGEGLRNTTPLQGRSGLGHGNVHWTANFDEIQDFEHDIRGPFGGRGFLTDEQFEATDEPLGSPKAGLSPELDALAAYLASLGPHTLPRSPHRRSDGRVTEEALVGLGVFRDLGCAVCHSGAARTDSTLGSATLHDVGTVRSTSGNRLGEPLDGIDTPTLLGVWHTAPYLHDGSAATLEDVFTVAGGSVLPAESGQPSGGGYVVENYVDLNHDDTVHGRAFVSLRAAGSTLTLSAVDGGPGGIGALELRYSADGDRTLEVAVNGVVHSMALSGAGNDPPWRHTNWLQTRLEGVVWNAGPSNTVELSSPDAYPDLSVDELVISTADDLERAEAHHRVRELPDDRRESLLEFLLQLDGRPPSP